MKPIPHDPMLPPYADMCRCMECGEYFNSSGTFSRHRTGDWDDRGANRRCLTIAEMVAKGWEKSKSGHWITSRRSPAAPTRRSASTPHPDTGHALDSGAVGTRPEADSPSKAEGL